mmetsp:Transcript_15565/g.23321  ORF Transcript_15565/g.23321 Transcript_15565/m.23321 type:complete len:101 (+) Transcript_15565:135-437(+)
MQKSMRQTLSYFPYYLFNARTTNNLMCAAGVGYGRRRSFELLPVRVIRVFLTVRVAIALLTPILPSSRLARLLASNSLKSSEVWHSSVMGIRIMLSTSYV